MMNRKAVTAGYSGTPLANKLGIKEGMTLVTVDAPNHYLELVEPLADGVDILRVESNTLATARVSAFGADIVHLFTNTGDGLFKAVSEARHLIKQNGSIWVSWYKKAAKLPTEITEDTIREAAFPLGLVDVKVCAVDEKWSGLKLVIRKENRV
ncbi:MAG: DUF3052 family protein [Pyrinomonadaceae bacterium]